jgi:glycosyltransferase 2 family protein
VSFLRGIGAAFAHARPGFVLLAVALHLAGLLVTGARWRIVAAALGGRLSLVRATLINLAGIFVRNVTPTTGLGGDAARIALFRAEGMPVPQATAAFVYVRAAEIPSLAVIVLMAIPALRDVIARSSRRIEIGAIVVTLAIAGMWIAWRRGAAALARLREWHDRVRIPPRVWTAAIAYAALAQVETLIRQMAIAVAFGFPLSFSQSATVTALGVAGGLVPTIGSVGTIEGGIFAALVLCGAPAPTAVAITVAERAISYALSTGLGAAALAGLGGRAMLRMLAERRVDAVPAA